MPDNWKVIINPYAGGNADSSVWQSILHELRASGIVFEYEVSQYHRHIISMVQQSIASGFRRFIVIGGDGSLNEVVNGIYSQSLVPPAEIITAQIALGTGNDWQRTHNLTGHYSDMIDKIKSGSSSVQDVGVVSFEQQGKTYTAYFVNVAGMGFDAFVVGNMSHKKEKKSRSRFSYLYSLFLSLINYKCVQARISVDGSPVFGGSLFSLSVGIGRFNGGGMMQLPHAIADDDLLDATLIRKVSKIKVIANIKNLYSGSFTRLKEVSLYKGTSITVDAELPLTLECDGELMGQSPASFSIIPLGFHFVC
jgi:YegS/Rv2252/BmrU family lipid kinase